MSHSHWCWRGQHAILDCHCDKELPVNIGCQSCIDKEDFAKDQKIQENLDKIIDRDTLIS